MLKLRLTHRRAKRWGRRAKSDGSCVPKIKRIRWMRHVPFARAGCFVGLGSWVIMMAIYGVWYAFLKLAQWGILSVFGISFNVSTFIHYTLIGGWVVLAFVVICQMHNFVLIYQMRKFKRAVVKSRCLVCPKCRYDLQSRSDDTQPCPECGQRISRRECVRLWARFCGR